MSIASGTKLLAIDDEPAILESFSAYFEDLDVEVVRATTGEAGLEMCRHAQPDIVLTDLRMPGISGLEVISALKAEFPDLPVIVVSGTGVLADAIAAVRAGAWDYVTKPIEDLGALGHVTELALERARLIRENRRHQEHLRELVEARTSELAAANRELSQRIAERERAEQEKEHLETQLRQAQKMEAIGRLAGGVAHDFNNILTAIFGNVELALTALEEWPSNIGPLDQTLRQINRAAQRAADLTRQLLTLGRRQASEPRVLSLNSLLAEMENMLQRVLSENIVLQLDLTDEVWNIRADPGQIEQVVMNLVVNACDALRHGGTLKLRTANVDLDDVHTAGHPDLHAGPHVALIVSDTGSGMDPETLHRVFEPFFTTKPVGQGTGLGLSTVYGIIKQAGGHIAVRSEPGRGSTFTIHLPAVEAPATTSHGEDENSAIPTGTETVLICEDDQAVLELTTSVLTDAGYRVLSCGSGREALDLAHEHGESVQLLLSDVIMPDMNGKELSHALATQIPGLRTLFMSGYTSDVIADCGISVESVEFLGKPFGRPALLRRVRQILDQVAPVVPPQHLATD